MKALLHIFIITVLLFASHFITSHYTYSIVAGLKFGDYKINFFSSRLSFWFWFVVTTAMLVSLILSGTALVRNKGILDLSYCGNYSWVWYAFISLSLVTSIYWFGGILINFAHKDSLAQFGWAYVSVIINLISIVAIVVYNMWKLVGEAPNKYVWITLVFFLATIISSALSVRDYIK